MTSLAHAHVVVAGAGGLGCPAAWALAEAGVGRITLVDPDSVEASNLPRQVLFHARDLGAPKAARAAAAVAPSVFAGGVQARLDDTTEDALLAGADVLLDASDGAHAKDWIHQAAVRRGVPLVHAAGLRSEARLLTVAAGGRPCLACLFGRLAEETGSCADLGVWNGVVGVAGFLAAQAALDVIAGRGRAAGYAVLDFEAGRALTLAVAARGDCPVCAHPGAREPYPAPFACRTSEAPGGAQLAPETLDLRAERCPMNLLRARQALAQLPAGTFLRIALGEEGAATVPDGVRALGHRVVEQTAQGAGLELLVEKADREPDDPAFDGEALQRYARQIVLPEVGERGQRRLARGRVALLGRGRAREAAATYLRAAGVCTVDAPPAQADLVAWAGGEAPPAAGGELGFVVALVREGDLVRARRGGAAASLGCEAPAAVALARGALLADLVQRHLVLDDAPEATFGIDDAGAVA